uniref:Secreted protein n=1 Tax=Plectus sambesii TaxID=2011161 RepID=A0A914WP71_9BILA
MGSCVVVVRFVGRASCPIGPGLAVTIDARGRTAGPSTPFALAPPTAYASRQAHYDGPPTDFRLTGFGCFDVAFHSYPHAHLLTLTRRCSLDRKLAHSIPLQLCASL